MLKISPCLCDWCAVPKRYLERNSYFEVISLVTSSSVFTTTFLSKGQYRKEFFALCQAGWFLKGSKNVMHRSWLKNQRLILWWNLWKETEKKAAGGCVLASVKPCSTLLFLQAGRRCVGATMSPCHVIVLSHPSEQFRGFFVKYVDLHWWKRRILFFVPLCSPQRGLCPVF